MTQQLGNGNASETIAFVQPIISSKQIAVGGVTVVPTAPAIASVPLTATTADIAALGVAVNAALTAMKNLGFITIS